jgi:hypothetical protein
VKFDLERDRVLLAISNYYEPEKALYLQKTLESAAKYINNAPLIHKLRLRVALCQADVVLVRDTLVILPPAKQEFFQARYRDKIPNTFLAPKLYLSPKQLISWNNYIFGLLADLIHARITEKVLSREKLLIAQTRLNTVLAVADGELSDASCLNELRAKQTRLENTLAKIEAYLPKIENSVERAVLADWTRDTSLTYVELAYQYHVSEASARRYIVHYKTKILSE